MDDNGDADRGGGGHDEDDSNGNGRSALDLFKPSARVAAAIASSENGKWGPPKRTPSMMIRSRSMDSISSTTAM